MFHSHAFSVEIFTNKIEKPLLELEIHEVETLNQKQIFKLDLFVSLLQMFHENSNNNIDQHKLSQQHKHDEEKWCKNLQNEKDVGREGFKKKNCPLGGKVNLINLFNNFLKGVNISLLQ